VREAIYAEIPPHERAERHAQAARLLGQLGADHARIAVQLLRSEPAADGWAVARLRDAAATALSQGARDPAVEFLRRALIEPPEESQRVPVLRELARAEGLAGSTTAIEHLREALTLAQDARVQADIGLELVFMLFVHGRMQDAVELSHTVLERLPPGDRTLELSVIAAAVTGAVLVPELRPRIDSFLARIPNDLRGETREERLATSARLAARLCRRASTDEVAELAERALGGGRLLEDLASYELLYWNAASALVVAERFDAARDAIQAGLADARRRGSSLGFALSSCFRSLLHYRTGDVAAGAADGRQALAVVQPSELMVRAYIVAFLIDCLIERDELDEALALASAPEFAAGLPPLLGFDFLRVARGRVYVLRGDARRGLDELLGVGTTSGAFGPAVCPWRARAAVALCALDERREAQRLAEGELADACATRCAWGEALALQALAMAAPDQATELLERAIAAAESRGLALERARAIVMLGAHLRRQGKRHEAAVLLREGIDAADACGALALGERAREEAVAIGLTPRSRRETGVDELTPAERRVAEMAASGMSNREIAQGLFVSLRTVETHLTHSYQKLGIESRSGLERALAAT
jgi:ATP/maltotriose-dependent transcriptional regulator MalT